MPKVLTYPEITQRLPARRPMLMLDRAQIADDAKSGIAIKAVTMNELFFQGHFPGEPIMPGVLQVAGSAQLSALLLEACLPCPAGKVPWLKGIHKYTFRKTVLPGDLIRLEASVVEVREDGIKTSCKIFIGNDPASDGTLDLVYIPEEAFLAPRPIEVTAAPLGDGHANIKQVMHHIPHRFPFLLVDRIVSLDVATFKVAGIKNVSGNESFMDGVGHPSMPGFLQVEAAAQCACVWELSRPENANKLGLFARIDKAVFHAPVVPGDQLLIEELLKPGRMGFSAGTVKVNGEVKTEFELRFIIIDKP